jgi:hypothetical protein
MKEQPPIKIHLDDYRKRSLIRRLIGRGLCALGYHRVPNYFVRGEPPDQTMTGRCARVDCRHEITWKAQGW